MAQPQGGAAAPVEPLVSITRRNQRNAQLSTGPRTLVGKRVSRRNALKHGLTANPAAGIVEDPRAFRRLLRALAAQIEPNGPVEEALVHRIACSIWRLQRAATIDAAITWNAAAAVVPARAEVQYWMERILDAWRVEVREVPSEQSETDLTLWRPGLRSLDQFRDGVLMKKGAAVLAMAALLKSLTGRLVADKETFGRPHHEQMAWLLGQPAACYDVDDGRAVWPDKFPAPWEMNRLIGIAKWAQPGSALPPALRAMIQARLDLFHHQSTLCEEPVDHGAFDRRRAAALLPDAQLLERLIRYESHGDRTLHRALEALARLRGVTVERIAASLTRTVSGQTHARVVGEQATVRVSPASNSAATPCPNSR